jgi:hypothetical protein
MGKPLPVDGYVGHRLNSRMKSSNGEFDNFGKLVVKGETDTRMDTAAALRTGFASLNGDAVIVTIDTDGQHDPADIPRLVAPILAGDADMVNGSRYLCGNKILLSNHVNSSGCV